MMVGHYTASIITHSSHYYASNMAAIFSECTLGEPQTRYISHPDIYIIIIKILSETVSGQRARSSLHSLPPMYVIV